MQYTGGYSLSLRDGQDWWITAVGGGTGCMDKLAAIMELKERAVNGSSKLIFCDTEDVGSVKNELKTSKNSCRWEVQDHKAVIIWSHGRDPDAICEVRNHTKEYVNIRYSTQPIFQRSLNLGGLPLHAALAELEGRGVLLVAPCGAGKSTCCRHLPDHWTSLCDDEALVVLDERNQYRAHPLPTWSEYLAGPSRLTWNTQYSVPVSVVFFLQQWEDDEVIPVGKGQAAVSMAESAAHVCRRFWRNTEPVDQRRIMEKLFSNACEMIKQIPAFRLRASLRGRFWEEIEKTFGY